MRRRLYPILLTTLLIGACSPAPVTQAPSGSPTTGPSSVPLALPSSNPDQLSSDIRPGSKGQRLEFSGEMEIPAGTSSYAIQSASAPSPTRLALLDLLIPPALADDADISDGDEPISDSQITHLTATVDGQSVLVTIDKISDQDDGSKLVAYTLKEVPEVDQNAIIEFSSPSGAFKIKGVVPKLDASVKKIDKLNADTTALAELLLNHPKKARHLTNAEIKGLLKSDAVQKLRDKVLELFVEPAAKPVKFEDGVKAAVQEVLQDKALDDFLNQDEACFQRGPQCTQKPSLPPAVERPIATALMAVINRRQQVRLKVVVGTHSPTLAERAALLKLGPLVRLKQCVTLKVYPCP